MVGEGDHASKRTRLCGSGFVVGYEIREDWDEGRRAMEVAEEY